MLTFVLAVSVFSCSSTGSVEKRHFELAQQSKDVTHAWPRGYSKPYYIYLGDIYGESNLSKIKNQQESTFSRIWSFLTGEIDQPPLNLKRPQGIIGDNKGKLYISDVSHQGIFAIDTVKGTLELWKNAGDTKHFISPVGVAVINANELLVADSELGYVVRLNANGVPIGKIAHNSLTRPTGIVWLEKRGEIYISDTENDDIKVFDKNGQLLRLIGNNRDNKISFNAPTYLAAHTKGLLVADTLAAKVQLIGFDGQAATLLHSYGQRGMKLGNLTRPKGVATDSEGNIYIIESYFDHMLVYNEQGQFLLPLGGAGHGAGEFYLPSGIWIDNQDRVYVADMMNGRISMFHFLGGN
ncbi:6-bladed beta-propeller [Thalassotalea sp. G2M2-11]|uniref:6-bladed beta-propeller n=1 Tax=Thalassotalea sp. G2M2-11 TaxID=2787627 RepID=UPI0019CF8492|nr:6-bladed beta-propeller [Thalassotalea sp. G2M2-11]